MGTGKAIAGDPGTVPAASGGRYREMRKVTVVGAVLDLVLGVAKVLGGWLTHSQALVADGIHSLSDLLTDLMVLFAAKHAHADADEEHPYGHERIETVATVALGITLAVVGIGIAVSAVRGLFDPETLPVPGVWALAPAIFSVVSKEAMYHYTMHYARRLKSNLLKANAWHTRSDAASSIVVIVGVSGALMGLPYLDAVAAVIVAWMIARIGGNLAWKSVQELIDTGLDPEQVEAIRDTITAVDGVQDLHMLRTRQMANKSLVDVHIILTDPRLSVSEGHQISETVRARLIRGFEDVEDVTVHIDPEDDEHVAPGRHLGLRADVLARLEQYWHGLEDADRIRRITLHYLGGRIHVDAELPLELGADPEGCRERQQRFDASIEKDPDIAEVRLLYV